MSVTLLVNNENSMESQGQMAWLKRQAIQVAAQLPEDRDQALKVLEYARDLVTDFMTKP